MACYSILAFFFVVINLANCLPPGSIPHAPRTPSDNWVQDKNTTSRKDDDKDSPPLVNQTTNCKLPAPSCADGSTCCETVDGYPVEIFEKMRSALDHFKALQETDELKTTTTQRIDSNTTTEENICRSYEEVVYPKLCLNKDNEWNYIINTSFFVQGVRIEKCVSTSAEQKCMFDDSFPNGYTSVCKQKYIYRKFVAVNLYGHIITAYFMLPSCCSCKVIGPMRLY